MSVDQFPRLGLYGQPADTSIRLNNGQNTFNLELDGAQTWELYRDCLLPDSEDSSMEPVSCSPRRIPMSRRSFSA